MIRLVIVLLLSGLIHSGLCMRCYECKSEEDMGPYDPCRFGDESFLTYRTCMEPSVCAAYHYQTETPYGIQLSTTRGCHAIKYGATCEDIFNDLRNTGQVLPGQHICTTCGTDLCNSSANLAPILSTITIFALIVANL